MVELVIGPKGSGKTKYMTEAICAAAQKSAGNVVYITKDIESGWDIPHDVRVIDLAEFPQIDTYGELYAFVCGLLSGNYDITNVFIDGLYALCGKQEEELSIFLALISELSDAHHAAFTAALSAKKDEVPEAIYQMVSDVHVCE